jgi:hypothetical protein
MAYVVYVNHQKSKARVHRADCQHYRDRVADATTHGFWRVGFATFEGAMTYARGTGKRNLRPCLDCLPQHTGH